jgi:hypothetical protein
MSLNRDIFVETAIDRILTQYRESPNLLGVIRYDIGNIADVAVQIDSIPSFFDIDTAIGDQLTLLGKRLGWPRCHCVCVSPPVFGFACDTTEPNQVIIGFCEEGVWSNCRAAGSGDICLDDDVVYRGFIKARRYQALQRYAIDDLQTAARDIWGSTAFAVNMGTGRAAVGLGRELTNREEMELPLAFRVLPFAPGVARYVHRGSGLSAGFGAGWGGFCDGSQWFCPTFVDPFACV